MSDHVNILVADVQATVGCVAPCVPECPKCYPESESKL